MLLHQWEILSISSDKDVNGTQNLILAHQENLDGLILMTCFNTMDSR